METYALTNTTVLIVAGSAFFFGTTIGWIVAAFVRQRSVSASVPKNDFDSIKDSLAASQSENQNLLVRVAKVEAILETERSSMVRERSTITADRSRIEDVFKSVGAEILREAMNLTEQRSAIALARSHERLEEAVAPVSSATQSIARHIQEIEINRTGSYERLSTTVETLGQTEKALADRIAALSSTTSGLAQALRNPSARGTWGEFHLKRVIELSGMIEYCDFDEQKTIVSEEGGSRPDVTVKVTDTQRVFVDAKAPLSAYLEASEATDERTRSEALKRHSAAVRTHMKTLASRGYAKKDPRASEMVVMYVPSEGALSAAVAQDRDLIEESLGLGIVLAGPMQLVALLRMFAYGWRQQQFERNADKVILLAKEFVERAGIFGNHMAEMQRSIVQLVKTYNAVAGSAESRILVTARRMNAFGAGSKDTMLEPLRYVEDAPRLLAAPELTGSET